MHSGILRNHGRAITARFEAQANDRSPGEAESCAKFLYYCIINGPSYSLTGASCRTPEREEGPAAQSQLRECLRAFYDAWFMGIAVKTIVSILNFEKMV